MMQGDPELRTAFETFQKAVVQGDFNTFYDMLSTSMKSRSILSIFTPDAGPNGPVYLDIAYAAFRRLPENLRADFEYWLRANRTNVDPGGGPIAPLPSEILAHAWVREALKAHFDLVQPHFRHEMAASEFREGYRDGQSATIMVKNIRQESEAWEAVLEERAWKINYYKRAPLRQR
jgi:hypothetical protein